MFRIAAIAMCPAVLGLLRMDDTMLNEAAVKPAWSKKAHWKTRQYAHWKTGQDVPVLASSSHVTSKPSQASHASSSHVQVNQSKSSKPGHSKNEHLPVWQRVQESLRKQAAKVKPGGSKNGTRLANSTQAVWQIVKATSDVLKMASSNKSSAANTSSWQRVKESSGNSTSAAWQRIKESARDHATRAGQELGSRVSKNVEGAKVAFADPKKWQHLKDHLKESVSDVFVGAAAESRAIPPELCGPARDLALNKATTVYSNIGGLGPDQERPQSLRIANVFPDGTLHVDMIVTATTTYFGNPDGRNALAGDFLVISVNSGSSVKVQFTFVDRMTGNPVEVPAFLFTIAGLDQQEDGSGKQRVTMSGHTDVYTAPEGSGVSVDSQAHGNTTFVSTLPAAAAAPKALLLKARNMSREYLARAVSVRMPHLSHFETTLSVDAGMGSRDFYFSGASSMVCGTQAACDTHKCPKFFALKPGAESLLCHGSKCTKEDTKTCCAPIVPVDCHPANTLKFNNEALHHSNLGGHGPDFGQPPTILYENVFPKTAGTKLDLEVSAASIYSPANVSLNGVAVGAQGSVSIAPGTSADLNFSFYEHGTRRLVKPSHSFYMSFKVFDKANGKGVDSFRIPSELIKLVKSDAAGSHESTDFLNRTVFASNTLPAANVVPEISVLLAPRTSFVLTASVPMGADGQALRFSGYSREGCPPRNSLCERVTCPGGHEKRLDALDQRCAAIPCALEDIGICCKPTEAAICDAKSRAKFAPDSLMESNLGGYGPDVHAPEHMLLTDIFPQSGSTVNMRLSAVGTYAMSSAPQNILTDGFVKLDVEPGSQVHLKLEFYGGEEAEPVTLPMFYLTVADIDKGFGDFSVESVGIKGHKYVNVTSGELRREYATGDWSFYSATEYGSEGNATALLGGDARKSLGAFFENVTELEFLLSVSKAKDGNSSRPRTFFIGGQTSLVCPVQQASCASYICPAKQSLRDNAATLSCEGSVCTEIDTRTCCRASNEDACSSTRAMVIAPHSLVHSNLCGLGPDGGEEALIYTDVFPGSGRKLDWVVEGVRGCAIFDVSRNGMLGNTGSISLQAGADMGLEFKVVEHSTRETVKSIWPYLVTFLNMDNDTSYVEIAVDNLQAYQVTDKTTWRMRNSTSRVGGGPSDDGDSHEPPHVLMPRRMARSVAMTFEQPAFNVFASVSEGFEGGHDLMFAGSAGAACSGLAFCSSAECPAGSEHREDASITACLGATCTELDTTTCCMRKECSEARALQFRPDRVRYSNLGGKGPDRGQEAAIVYADVFPFSGQEVDLEVTAVGAYFLSNASMNGVDGPFGSVNMGPGSDLTLEFRFVEPGTKTPASVESFFFSLVNVTDPPEAAGKRVSVSGYESYETPEHTKLREEKREGLVFFSSGTDGEDWRLHGHPNHPLSLGRVQLNHSVTFLMPARSNFTVSASLPAGWLGTNILFAGASNIMCPHQALCSSYECPAEWELRADAHRAVCRTLRCNHLDVEQCCIPQATTPRLPHSIWSIDEDVLPELPPLPSGADEVDLPELPEQHTSVEVAWPGRRPVTLAAFRKALRTW